MKVIIRNPLQNKSRKTVKNLKPSKIRWIWREVKTNRVDTFTKLIMEGPVNICIICNRCFYARSVLYFHQDKYDMDMDKVLCNFTQQEHICRTCSLWNKILNRLERLLIFRRLLFKKVTIMPKGCFPKLKGKIRNITVETNDIANVLPRGADSNGLIFVKINQKLSYRGHVYLEPVSPGAVQLALVYLKQNNPFYHKIRIDIDNISMNYLIWLKT